MREEELPEGDDFRGDEFPAEDEGEGEGTFACPRCGASIYADAVRCASCGDYVTPGAPPDRPREWLPWWVWLGLVFAGLILLGLLLR